MNYNKRTALFISTIMIATIAFLGGCVSTGMKRSENTSHSIQHVDIEIKKMMVQIDATAASLDALVSAGKTDPKKSFEIFSDNVTKLESEGKRVTARLDEMKAKSREYFEEWEKQGDKFTNAELRQLSDERKSKLAAIYAEVPAANAGIKGSYNAYLADLKEIQKYLSNDLTPLGIDAIKPVAQKSVQNLEQLKLSLKPVITALDQISAELYHKSK